MLVRGECIKVVGIFWCLVLTTIALLPNKDPTTLPVGLQNNCADGSQRKSKMDFQTGRSRMLRELWSLWKAPSQVSWYHEIHFSEQFLLYFKLSILQAGKSLSAPLRCSNVGLMERWREIWKYQLFEQVFSSVGKDWNQYDPGKDHTYTDIDREACQVDAIPSPNVLRKKCKFLGTLWCLHFWPSLTVKYSLNIRKNMQYQFCVSKWPPFDFLPTTSSISAKTDFPYLEPFLFSTSSSFVVYVGGNTDGSDGKVIEVLYSPSPKIKTTRKPRNHL